MLTNSPATNGNMESIFLVPPTHPRSSTASPIRIMDPPVDNQMKETFFYYGLVEALLPVNDLLLWQDAYIIDVEKDQTSSKDEPTAASHVCTVVPAIYGEDPFLTLNLKKNVQKCKLDQIRLKLQFDPNFTISDQVQVATELYKPLICWKQGFIKMTKDNFFIVIHDSVMDNQSLAQANPSVQVNDLSSFDIVPSDRLRPIDAHKQLSEIENPFFRFVFPLPKEFLQQLKGDLKWLSLYEVHKEFKRCLQLINVYYDAEKKALICLGFAMNDKTFIQQQAIKRCKMLSSLHFASLKENQAIYASNLDYIISNQDSNDFLLHLKIDPKYIGLAIGKNGVNIQKARHLPGILSLDINSFVKNMFDIRGTSQEACQQASDLLNFCDEKVRFPKSCIGIFSEHKLMHEIVVKSSVFKIEICPPNEGDEFQEFVELLVIGRPQSIDIFKFLFGYQVAEYEDIQELKLKHKNLFQELFKQHKRIPAQVVNTSPTNFGKNFAEVVKSGMKS